MINFDMPATADDYIHRIGRTGRAERTGDAFTLVTPDDRDMIRSLEKIIGAPLSRQTLEGFNYTAPAPILPAGDRRDHHPARRAPVNSAPHAPSTRRPARPTTSPGTSLRRKFAQEKTR